MKRAAKPPMVKYVCIDEKKRRSGATPKLIHRSGGAYRHTFDYILFVKRHGQLNAPVAYEHALYLPGLLRVVADGRSVRSVSSLKANTTITPF